MPSDEARELVDHQSAVGHSIQGGLRVGQHFRAYFGESHGASGTVQEGLTELGLEPTDLGANARLGDVEPCGRPREVGLFGDSHKVLELSQFHN